jgi:hypothetical protein
MANDVESRYRQFLSCDIVSAIVTFHENEYFFTTYNKFFILNCFSQVTLRT